MEQGQKHDQAATVLSVIVSMTLALFVMVMVWPQDKPQKPINKPLKKTEQKAKPEDTQPVVLSLPEPPKPAPKAVSHPTPKAAPKPVVKPQAKPEAKSIAKPITKAVAKPIARPAAKITADKSQTTSTSQSATKQVTASDLSTGRPLLRILEHGKGPSIEIAWPGSSTARNRLYNSLSQCFGMTVALMDRSGNLYRSQDPAGQRWDINLDHYSGFVRQPSGAIPQAERTAARKISRKHPRLSSGDEVRIFPRRVDAILLGSLHNLIGSNYTSAHSIHAQYSGSGKRLIVQNITVDGKRINGRIDLSRAASCR